MTQKPTVERVRGLFAYDPVSGELRWLVKHSNRAPVGSLAGSVAVRGNRQIKLDGRVYKFHHIVWLHAYGEWPIGEVDHIDGNPLNNALANLRLATPSQNSWNVRTHKDNKSGFKGVSLNGRRYVAEIMAGGVRRRLGRFDTAEEAHNAYCRAAAELHGTFARVA